MIFLKIDNETQQVTFVHLAPFDALVGLGKSSDELKNEGLLVESLPKPVHIEGKTAVLKVDPQSHELYFDYVDTHVEENELEKIKQKQDLMQQAIDELIFGGAF